MSRRRTAVLLLAPLLLAAAPSEVPSPESVLGFPPGKDRTLADWTEIAGYFRTLDVASPRVAVEELGKTTQGRPFLLATLTSEANHARLPEIRRANLRLADPRGLPAEEARRLVTEGKVIVALHHGIHATEVAATQTAMETAAWLARGDDPEAREVLENVVVLMLPSHNPDGTQMVTDWYEKTLGTAWEGADPPFLYHPYTGHDNNRDWYMFTQVESRLTVTHLYERWRPQVVHDLHQMGRTAARLFVPPYLDPWEPNVDPALRAAANGLGAHVAAQLTAEGKTGVVINAIYDAWSPSRAYPHTHGGIRLLSEVASARLATPVEVKPAELGARTGYDAKVASWNHPAPWPGGPWRVRDIMDYQLSATRAVLLHAARHRSYWLQNFLDVNRRAATRTSPHAFVAPAGQKDPHAVRGLLEVLRLAGVEVHRAKEPFGAAGRTFPAGSFVVAMAQPTSGFAKTVLERQAYPDLRVYPGGPPLKPYDVTAHTLPLLMGVEVVEARDAFAAALEPVADPQVPGRIEGGGRWLALGHRTGDLVAAGRLLAKGVPVRWALDPVTAKAGVVPAGALLVPASARALLTPLAAELGLQATALDALPRSLALDRPRVGLYQSYQPSMDEGWTRFVLERLAVPYVTLHDADVRAGNLRARFDAVVIPEQSASSLRAGRAPGTLPAEYTGGLGKEGGAALAAFVEAGGTLVALNTASEYAIAELGLPVANALAGVGTEFYCPGAILRVSVDTAHPLAHGLDASSVAWFEDGPAFELAEGAGTVVARYPEEDPLLSGWLLGGSKLEGRAALVEVPKGKGRVVLFGYRPQYRAQSWATYMPFVNALYLASAVPRRS